ncbi:MAG: hypothetical protein LBI16_01365 [Burkholderiales bacterium]|jgi:type IV pilus assembly protein PilV|nr:hypothetical protein [Burkholderiales bacterium]
MLLEVLVSILIFALGIVALVGLQGRSLMMTDDVQYRAEAIHLANAYMGQIWASGLTGTNLQNAFQTNGTRWGAFRDQVVGVAASGGDLAIPGIPGGQPPQVNVVNRTADVIPAGGGAAVTILGDDVTITISWLDRQDGTTMHSYVQTSSVGY